MSCSLERPPMITATRTRAIGSELTNEDVDRAAVGRVGAAGRVLILDDVVLIRVGAGDVGRVDLEAVGLQVVHGHLLVLPDLIRDRGRARPARDGDRYGRALRSLSASVRILIRDVALRRGVRRSAR